MGALVRCLDEGLHATNAMVKLPLLLPGEYAVTDVEPARSLYARLPEIEAEDGVLDASLLIGCAWTDSPHTAVSALVVAERDPERAQRHARALADEVWERRREFGPDTETLDLDEAVREAMASADTPVVIADSGDNPGAGGAGDLPLVLRALLTAGAQDAVVGGIADPEAVCECTEAGVGSRVALSIGGKLDQTNGEALEVTGNVEHLTADSATIQVEGIRVVLTTQRRAMDSAEAYIRAGVEPEQQRIIVVKCGYLSPEMRRLAGRSIMALTPGFTSLRLQELPYRRVQRPIFPLDDM